MPEPRRRRRWGSRERRCLTLSLAIHLLSCRPVAPSVDPEVITGPAGAAIPQLDAALAATVTHPRRATDRPDLLLERGTALLAAQRPREAAADLTAARRSALAFDLDARPEALAAVVYRQPREARRWLPSERIAILGLQLQAELEQGDDGAAVKTAADLDAALAVVGPGDAGVRAAFAAVLAAVAAERVGDRERALARFEDALRGRELPSQREAIARLHAQARFRGERVDSYAGSPRPLPANGAQLVVVVHAGRAPARVVERLPLAAAVGRAGALAPPEAAALAVGPGTVAVPVLRGGIAAAPAVQLRVDGHQIAADLAADLARELVADDARIQAGLLAGVVDEIAVRRSVGAPPPEAGDGRPPRADLDLERPDVRSWRRMPARTFVGRVDLPAGSHVVELGAGEGKAAIASRRVDLSPGGIAVVSFFVPD